MGGKQKSSIAKWKEQQKLEKIEAKLKMKRDERRMAKQELEREMDEEQRQDNLGADDRERELEAKRVKENREAAAAEEIKRYAFSSLITVAIPSHTCGPPSLSSHKEKACSRVSNGTGTDRRKTGSCNSRPTSSRSKGWARSWNSS